ncbi:diguanylate cyclase [Metabacillus iocasae]|uniref:Diguanylate cyclase (GGDEF)-like protein n=1 Tax=Priestia iocasae TaxID=2291674 RepID=A0ABS2QVI3_9BACI|nr:diguanylate cyclase (GGDEF)-like protein [Metabacillus iocasae]
MEKYQVALFKNVRKTLKQWFEDDQIVPHTEVIRFLHSLAGTAQTVGLNELGEVARHLMEDVEQQEPHDWSNSELRTYLATIIRLCYQDEITPVEEHTHKVVEGEPVVLLIDDDTTMLMYLKEEMEKAGWYVVAVTSTEKAITAFYESKPHCIVLDVHMKEQSGFELLLFLKNQTSKQFVPTIMISVDNQKKTRLKAFEMGADDFIAKPLEMDEFLVRLGRHLERKRLFDYHLLVDELTGVYNRKYLTSIFTQQQGEYKRLQEAYSLVIVDLDHFKKVNDTYGHLHGDYVLKEFSSFLKEKMRASDYVFRYGGEEFVLLLPRTTGEEAQTLLDRLLHLFAKKVFSYETHSFSCTFSGGIVEVDNDYTRLEEWLEQADQALYKAKDAGRNQVIMASPVEERRKRTLRIAIVDDDPVIRTMLTEVMKKVDVEGMYEVMIKAFKDGETFLQDDWTHQDDHYFVILDGMMPKMDGLEVLQRLRKEKREDKYKVIMLTTRRSERDIKKALELGADDYITKPFKLLELEARVRHLMKRVK